MKKKCLCLLVLVLFTSGCARQAMLLSYPPGAEVSVNGNHVGVTPCEYEYAVNGGERYTIVLSKAGYRTASHEVVADQSDKKLLKRWMAAGLVWSPLWLGTLFTKRLHDSYLFNLTEDPNLLLVYHP